MSMSSVSTTSLILDSVSDAATLRDMQRKRLADPDSDLEMNEKAAWKSIKPVDRKARRIFWIVGILGCVAWGAALFSFIWSGSHKPMSSRPHNPHATATVGSGQKVTLDQVLGGIWGARTQGISWTESPDGQDGLLLQQTQGKEPYLVLEDVRYMKDAAATKEHSKVLMKSSQFTHGEETIVATNAWPSKDHKNVLVQSDRVKNWRHSDTGRHWIQNVKTGAVDPLDPSDPNGRIQLASWSPQSDVVVFTRDNNLYRRDIRRRFVQKLTTDGGPNYFYGIPDWVYEEEIFQGASGTWWSEDGRYIAYLRTNETTVPTFPVDYFFSRPSGQKPKPGEEAYPDTVEIKYPKAGAPMSTVSLLIHDMVNSESFEVTTKDDFPDDDRLIQEVVWAGGKVIVKETNRESDILKVILMDAETRQGKTVRETDFKKLDNGWYDPFHSTRFVPADPAKGRQEDGYLDTVIHDGYEHIAYFTPLDSATPRMLTSGDWEVVGGPSALDLDNNLVYFTSTKEHSTQRHVYSVNLDGKNFQALTNTSEIAYYGISYSAGAGYALLSYQGPGIPWQKVISTPANKDSLSIDIEDNKNLRDLATRTELPIEVYQTVTLDGYELNLVERRPPHFNPKRKYPVLFYLYGGPGAQEVDRRFTIDFQSYIASSLGYIVVTLDNRGTGFRGRATRNIIREHLGAYEAHDQIEAAKMWAAKPYVDADRLAIWGWSYGGFMTLKVLETDAGRTFKYGMAVAPVTDFHYYDSVYTERYMLMPQHNHAGYENTSISDAHALGENVRFLVMHGASDDNVHIQNTLSLLDKLDQAGVRNYDMHVFPDSDHGIYFHGARSVVYHKLRDWLVNAFNGEWLKVDDPVPVVDLDGWKRR